MFGTAARSGDRLGQVRMSPTGAESPRRWTTAGVGSSNSSMLGESPCRLTTAAPRTPRPDRYLRQARSCRGPSACPGSVLHFAHSSGDVCSLVDFARLPRLCSSRAARLMPRGADGPVGVKAPGAVCNIHVQLRFDAEPIGWPVKHGLRPRSGAVSPGFPLKYAGSPVADCPRASGSHRQPAPALQSPGFSQPQSLPRRQRDRQLGGRFIPLDFHDRRTARRWTRVILAKNQPQSLSLRLDKPRGCIHGR